MYDAQIKTYDVEVGKEVLRVEATSAYEAAFIAGKLTGSQQTIKLGKIAMAIVQ